MNIPITKIINGKNQHIVYDACEFFTHKFANWLQNITLADNDKSMNEAIKIVRSKLRYYQLLISFFQSNYKVTIEEFKNEIINMNEEACLKFLHVKRVKSTQKFPLQSLGLILFYSKNSNNPILLQDNHISFSKEIIIKQLDMKEFPIVILLTHLNNNKEMSYNINNNYLTITFS